jgi:DHA1 family bicyclomycin/chloramphenicol resistance-like MFS transporter
VQAQKPPRHLPLLLGTLTAFGPLSIDMYLPAFPQITREMAARPGAVSLTLAVFLLAVSLSQVFYGPLADRYGRRKPLLVGCVLYALGSLGCALAPSMGILIAARAVQALGGAAGMVVARAVVRDVYHEREAARVFSELMLVMGAAPILAPWLGGKILLLGSWRLIFFLLAGFGAFCWWMTNRGLPETLPHPNRSRENLRGVFDTFGALLANRRFLGYALVAGFTAGTNFAYISGSSFVYIELHGISAQHFGYFFGANALGLIGAAQINRLLLRRFAPESILDGSLTINMMAGCALVACGATNWGGLPALAALLFVSLASVGLTFPNLMAAAMAPFGRMAGSASAVLGTVQFAVGALAGALVGLLHNGTALPMTAVVASCATGGLIALRTLAPSKRLPRPFVLSVPED